MIKRPFSKALYEAYDAPARNALVIYLEDNGHTIVNNQENYNVDVVSQKNGLTYYNEVEVKTAWKGDWPTHWAEVRLPERKKRLKEKHTDGVLNFYIFRPDFKQAWRIKDTLLTDESLREAKGRYIVKGEKFFHIPYTKAELVKL
ncbi:hypothetical protein OAI26_03640 [Sulfitobacter sp.]|jgi:hypothetical protein|nr:hypothetical protein [Sulfitobacter sp.]|tara:strand:- start:323 stop:757 length:435 start_codon:yes stop_codon:yes gene_type:complete